MATVRFLHTADWHLGAGFGSLSEDVASVRQQQQRDCIAWLVERAVDPQSRVDVFLMAGDVFDTPDPSPRDIGFFESQLRRLFEAEVQTFIIPGTGGHDAYRSGGVWDRVNLHGACLFRGAAFDGKAVDGFGDLVVWGVACDPARPDANLLASAAELRNSGRSIGLYHGGLAGRYEQEGERGNAFQEEDVQRAPFNYLALGHFHRVASVLDGAKKKAYYPGSPTATGFRSSELGTRHVLEGQLLDDGQVILSRVEVPLAWGTHRAERLDCSRLSLEEINEQLRSWADQNAYMTVALSGIVAKEVMAEARELEQRHRNDFGYLRLSLDFEDLSDAEESEYLRLFRERALEAIEKETDAERKAVLREALILGTEALLRGGAR